MYRRYSQTNAGGISMSQIKHNRIRDLLILVLAGLLIAALVLGIPAMQKQSNTRSLYIQRIQAECDDAIRQTSALSRNAGANSAAILAQIRSNVYAIGVLNEVRIGEEGAGGRLLQEDQVTSLQSYIDNYLSFLTTGMDTGEYQTNLQNSLETLQVQISALE